MSALYGAPRMRPAAKLRLQTSRPKPTVNKENNYSSVKMPRPDENSSCLPMSYCYDAAQRDLTR